MDIAMLKELRHALFGRVALDSMPGTWWARVSAVNTWASNAIEGNTLSLGEVEEVILEGRSVCSRPMRDVLETVQHDRAFRHLIERRLSPISLVTVLELHEEVFRGILGDAGQWRGTNVRIAGSGHSPPRAEKVVPSMRMLIDEYARRDVEGACAFELGAWLHWRFEGIHPFSDGNGRVGRLLLNLHLLRYSWLPVCISPSEKSEYLSALDRAAENGQSDLKALITRAEGVSLLKFLNGVGGAEDRLLPLEGLTELGPFDQSYLSARAEEGALPAVRREGAWHSSPRALRIYQEKVGRK